MPQRFPLKRREIVALLLVNGFQFVRTHGSHRRYEGAVDGVTRYVEVDEAIDEFPPQRHRVLGHILAQLGFFDDAREVPASVGWDRFYSGEPGIARRAQLQYRTWDDPHWEQWYRR
jgi:hypothetical protein